MTDAADRQATGKRNLELDLQELVRGGDDLEDAVDRLLQEGLIEDLQRPNPVLDGLYNTRWGEMFSDTINTGIYILEPDTVKLIPPKTNFDFSQNLYPLMLSRNMKLMGKVADGYWKDVGNIDEYARAHQDLEARRTTGSTVLIPG